MHQNPGLVVIVIRVAGDMVATFQDGDAESDGLGEATGAHGAGVSRADDDHVVRVRVEVLRETESDLHDSSLQAVATSLPMKRRAGSPWPAYRVFIQMIIAVESYNYLCHTNNAHRAQRHAMSDSF